ncbi:unnamed protein product [Didymodactylos carnosus]|uniref:Uncharacterized protein n=1 Tax=Didymodactylos carnosus TaxID=1234261 RepID=A0A814AX47_9BILA|nr:unnamed protein product [Didymodactylos carnosus]CAF0921151.1 unnamed protein product [Didymodactylos carnosus]CAF3660911.1 unnamed protein product [Didymodactylos carnosus]CAF3700452.1 unnamed protein product [Didymodactylos carnosus]
MKALICGRGLISEPQEVLKCFEEHYRDHFRFPIEKVLRETKEEVQRELELAFEQFSSDQGEPFTVMYHEIRKELGYLHPKRALDPQGTSNIILKKNMFAFSVLCLIVYF